MDNGFKHCGDQFFLRPAPTVIRPGMVKTAPRCHARGFGDPCAVQGRT